MQGTIKSIETRVDSWGWSKEVVLLSQVVLDEVDIGEAEVNRTKKMQDFNVGDRISFTGNIEIDEEYHMIDYGVEKKVENHRVLRPSSIKKEKGGNDV